MFSEAGTTDLRNIFQIDGEGCQVQNSLALDMTATIDFIQDDVCTCKLLAFDLETRPTHSRLASYLTGPRNMEDGLEELKLIHALGGETSGFEAIA